MFIAKISKGRTIKQFINGTLTAPVLYSIFWMVIFGGAGIRHEREASNLGLCCNKPENGNFFLAANETQTIIADRGIESEKMYSKLKELNHEVGHYEWSYD